MVVHCKGHLPHPLCLLKKLKPSKYLCSRHSLIPISCLQHFKRFSGGFPQLHTKFNADTLFHFGVSDGAVKQSTKHVHMKQQCNITLSQLTGLSWSYFNAFLVACCKTILMLHIFIFLQSHYFLATRCV